MRKREPKLILPRRSPACSVLSAGMLAILACLYWPAGVAAQKPKLPKPRVLERGVRLERDASTGELRAAAAPDDSAGEAVIRSRVTMIQVGCSVIASDGTPVRGLAGTDFSVWEDGVEQTIASFDATAMPASIALLFDASPSIAREQGEMRDVAQSLSHSLSPEDEVAVAAFADRTLLLLPFSRKPRLAGCRAGHFPI